MPKPMTAKELKAIRARCGAITGGNWAYSVNVETEQPATLFSDFEGNEIDIAAFEIWDGTGYDIEMAGNAEFIVHAPDDALRCLDEIERLRGVLQGVLTKHNFLQYWSKDQACECDPDVGMSPCMKHAAYDIINMITKALAGEEVG